MMFCWWQREHEKKKKTMIRLDDFKFFQQGNPDHLNNDLPMEEKFINLPYDECEWEIKESDIKLGM